MNHSILSLSLAALCSLSLGCDSSDPEPADQPRDGELLFDLSEDELVEIHDAYVAEEDIALTRARLTAPFDCALYDDFCAQVGADAALEITGEMIDLALEEAPLEEIEVHLGERIDEVMQRNADAPADDGLEFRGSGSWSYDTQGNIRLAVRNGVTTPIVGHRHAWTESKAQKNTWLGWNGFSAFDICANTGLNTQTRFIFGQFDAVINSADPMKTCTSGKKSRTQTTYVDRYVGNGDVSYKVLVQGCGSGALEHGMFFQVCAQNYAQWF